jgi:hypothetical protein
VGVDRTHKPASHGTERASDCGDSFADVQGSAGRHACRLKNQHCPPELSREEPKALELELVEHRGEPEEEDVRRPYGRTRPGRCDRDELDVVMAVPINGGRSS